MSEKKEKVYKKLDADDWSKQISLIVDQFFIQSSSRDLVTDIVKELNKNYGIKKPVIRAVASSIYKHNEEELKEQSSEILELISKCV